MHWSLLVLDKAWHTVAFASTMPSSKGAPSVGLPVAQVLSGAMTVAYATVGLYFLKFWRRSKDGLYGFFAAAFALLAVQRVGLGLFSEKLEDDTPFYMVRLLAFCLILVGIYLKNRPSTSKQ
jgi:hypothetical protein